MKGLCLGAALLLAACGNSISGTVTLLGAPTVATGSVALAGPTNRSVALGADGSFAFEDLPDGTYKVTSVIPSTAAESGVQVEVDAQHRDLQLTLVVEAAGTVTGLVTATQIPLSGVTVTVADSGQQAVSGVDGRYAIPLVPVGFHWLHVTPTRYGAVDTQVFAVTFDQTTELPPIDFEQDLRSSGALWGRVVLAGLGPVSGAQAGIEGQVVKTAMTDANGYFVFPSIIGGNYTLTVTLAGTVEGSQTMRNVLVDTDAVTDAGTISFTPN